MPGAVSWRDELALIEDPAITAVLTVQCGLSWLRPASASVRDEIDEAIARLALARPAVRMDRIVLHSLPAIADIPPDELGQLNRAHADWLYRLALVGAMLPDGARPRIHRLIVAGHRRSVDAVDGIHMKANGKWPHAGAALAALDIVRRPGATTPLTGYDIDLDGPFGDTDPSVYL